MAELWMGAHPRAPSQVLCDGTWRSLAELIEASPAEILGTSTSERFANRLPFLFKVLAPARPLSVQAHPNREQARQGFARENALGVPLDAPQRNYRDDSHKPELICALTAFWALNGFREVAEILAFLDEMRLPSLSGETASLREHPTTEGFKCFFSALLAMDKERQARVVREAISRVDKGNGTDPVRAWLLRLARQYPGDIGSLSPIFLNLVKLQPQEAMYLAAGRLHAYLEGVGIELMANSDNVLRGGLTGKHVDVRELLAVLDFGRTQIDILTPTRLSAGEGCYHTPATEFLLSVLVVTDDRSFTSELDRSVEIVLCTEGEATVTDLGEGDVTHLATGTSIVVPAAVAQYRIDGTATLYRASVPP
jgi:mannose-6-phosphate isomerase